MQGARLGHGDGLRQGADEARHARAGARRDGNHRHAQTLFQQRDVHALTALFGQVHHVEGHQHRQAHLDELHHQIQAARQLRGIHDADHRIGQAAMQTTRQGFVRNMLFAGARSQAVAAWQIDTTR